MFLQLNARGVSALTAVFSLEAAGSGHSSAAREMERDPTPTYVCLCLAGFLVIDGRLRTPYEAMTLPRARRPNQNWASRAAGHSLTPRSLNRGPQEVGWKIRTESLDSPPQCSDARARSMEALVPSTGIAGLLAAARQQCEAGLALCPRGSCRHGRVYGHLPGVARPLPHLQTATHL